MSRTIKQDVALVGEIQAVPTILEVICKTTGLGFAAVARVTKDDWIACDVLDTIGFGLKPGDSLRVETTICDEIHSHGQIVVIDNVSDDPQYCNHPTPAMYGFQSYISVPINLSDGSFFGTLCAIDPRPIKLNNPETIGMFRLFAELLATQIESLRKLHLSETSLESERSASELREQFIAVLGHDLRNPLAAISSGTQLLLRREREEKNRALLLMMAGSVKRMSDLIDNILDFASGRLGGGITLSKEDKLVEPTLLQVIDEVRSAWPDREIKIHLDIQTLTLKADHPRLGQLFSNLLGNAITHGSSDRPVIINAKNDRQGFILSVSNAGAPIPSPALGKLFQPFYRGKVRPNQQGLGLGLFISSQIASAHDGTLKVASDETETKFTLQIPLP